MYVCYPPTHERQTPTHKQCDPDQELKMARTKRKLTFNNSSNTAVLQFDYETRHSATHKHAFTSIIFWRTELFIFVCKHTQEEAATWSKNSLSARCFLNAATDRPKSVCCLWRLMGHVAELLEQWRKFNTQQFCVNGSHSMSQLG